MKVASGMQMKQIDKTTIEHIGIPGIVLMENAALAVVEQIKKRMINKDKQNIAIVCGQGNNGGDGFAVARHLHQKGIQVKVLIFGKEEKFQGDAKINLEIIKNLKISIKYVSSIKLGMSDIRSILQKSDIIVDALFGTGLSRNIEGIYARVIEDINKSEGYKIAVDIPTGIHAETGEILGIAVEADETVTFALPKSGLYLWPGRRCVGNLIIADIGIPRASIEKLQIAKNVLTEEDAKKLMPARISRSNKGNYGKILVIAGSVGMTGAATLTCMGALRSGAGMVTLAIPQSLNHIMEVKLTEVMTLPLPEKEGKVLKKSFDVLKERLQDYNTIIIGPGLGRGKEVEDFLRKVLEEAQVPVVIDADGLNSLVGMEQIIRQYKKPVILTPHPGEMSRLNGQTISQIMNNPIRTIEDFCEKWQTIAVLKTENSIIGNEKKEIYINTTGNAGMATAGSGDVLAGIIGGLIAQKVPAFESAVLGVYLHAAAGDMAAEQKGMHSIIASDIYGYLPYMMKKLYM